MLCGSGGGGRRYTAEETIVLATSARLHPSTSRGNSMLALRRDPDGGDSFHCRSWYVRSKIVRFATIRRSRSSSSLQTLASKLVINSSTARVGWPMTLDPSKVQSPDPKTPCVRIQEPVAPPGSALDTIVIHSAPTDHTDQTTDHMRSFPISGVGID